MPAQLVEFRTVDWLAIEPGDNVTRQELGDLSQLIRTLRAGQRVTPLTCKQKHKKYLLVAGFRRYYAVKELNEIAIKDGEKPPFPTVPIELVEGNDVEMVVANIQENLGRLDPHFLEVATACAKMRERFNLDQGEIAERLGLSKSTVCEYLLMHDKLDQKIFTAVLRGENVPRNELVRWCRLDDKGKQFTEYAKWRNNKRSRMDLDGSRSEAKREKKFTRQRARYFLREIKMRERTEYNRGAICALEYVLGLREEMEIE